MRQHCSSILEALTAKVGKTKESLVAAESLLAKSSSIILSKEKEPAKAKTFFSLCLTIFQIWVETIGKQ